MQLWFSEKHAQLCHSMYALRNMVLHVSSLVHLMGTLSPGLWCQELWPPQRVRCSGRHSGFVFVADQETPLCVQKARAGKAKCFSGCPETKHRAGGTHQSKFYTLLGFQLFSQSVICVSLNVDRAFTPFCLSHVQHDSCLISDTTCNPLGHVSFAVYSCYKDALFTSCSVHRHLMQLSGVYLTRRLSLRVSSSLLCSAAAVFTVYALHLKDKETQRLAAVQKMRDLEDLRKTAKEEEQSATRRMQDAEAEVATLKKRSEEVTHEINIFSCKVICPHTH